MLRFIGSFFIVLSLTACGPHGDKKDHNLKPSLSHAVLVDYKPIKGTRLPLVQYFKFNEQKKLLEIYFLSEIVNTTSWITFRGSALGKNLIGAMFKNGDPNRDFYLWFKIQLTPQQTATYTLDLTHLGPNIVGFESLKLGDQEETRVSVTYVVNS